MLLGVGVCAANRVVEMIRETKRTELKPRMPSLIAFGVLVVNAVKQICWFRSHSVGTLERSLACETGGEQLGRARLPKDCALYQGRSVDTS